MTIKEVSQKYNISQDTLRYYERVGLIPTVARTSGGIRNYTENDLGWVENAICMRNAGVPIEALIEYVKLYQEGDETFEARRQLLQEQLDALKEQHAHPVHGVYVAPVYILRLFPFSQGLIQGINPPAKCFFLSKAITYNTFCKSESLK